jgi:hypothetical protein
MPIPTTILPLSSSIAVNALTVLFAFTDFQNYESILITGFEIDGVGCQFILDTAEDGASVDSDKQQSLPTNANGQCTFEIGPRKIRRYFRLSANVTAGATHVKYQVTGRPQDSVFFQPI